MRVKPLTLSLVIPAYNEEDHLKMCLSAVAEQSVMPDEVIVVDNNSTDQSAQVARQFSFVRVVPETRQGIVYARNAGFNVAADDLIGRIDADTILPADWVERIKDFYKVPGNSNKVLTGGAKFRNMPMPRLCGQMQNLLAFWLNWLALGHHIVWGSNMVMPSAAWRDVRDRVCDAPYIHEDIDLAIHLHEGGVPIVFQPKLLVSAVMRRVLTDRAQLWPNLKWWPRTLRLHHKKTWPLTVLGAASVYLMALIVRLIQSFSPEKY